MNEDEQKTILQIKAWLDAYPKRKGIVVLFDAANMTIDDIANTSGYNATYFATKYLAFVESQSGFKDMLIEELPNES